SDGTELITIERSTFSGNILTSGNGSAVYINNGSPVFRNNTFSGNTGGFIVMYLPGTTGTFAFNSFVNNGSRTDIYSGTHNFIGNLLIRPSQSNCVSIAVSSSSYNISDDTSCGFVGTGDQQNVSGLNTLPDLDYRTAGSSVKTHALPVGHAAINAAGSCAA